jgi:hypothetical protein
MKGILRVNLLKSEHFRPEFNNNNSKLLASCVFIETIIITESEHCINDMVGSDDDVATFTLRGDNKKKVMTSETIKQGGGQL